MTASNRGSFPAEHVFRFGDAARLGCGELAVNGELLGQRLPQRAVVIHDQYGPLGRHRHLLSCSLGRTTVLTPETRPVAA